MGATRDEMRTAFDAAIDRRGTGSLKWDGMGKRFGVEGDDLLPMWVADMEFPAPAAVIEALIRRARHGIFGYSAASPTYFSAGRQWMVRRHASDVKEEWVAATPGLLVRLSRSGGDSDAVPRGRGRGGCGRGDWR